jgi:type I restriction enzyme, S subunit
MTLPRYKEHKDTANQWLGKIPSHWKATKLGYLTSKIGSGKTPHGGADVYTSSGILFLRSQNVYDEGLALGDVVYIRPETDAEMSWSRVAPGDILLNITGASLGRTCLVPREFGASNVNQHVCIIRLFQEELRPYIALVMKSAAIKAQIDATQNGAAREGLNFEQISKLVLSIPPLSEQTAIAAFLDRETGKIDALVAEQEKLIALLTEKRQAVISHALTKGLDPAAPMKDSGIEWLGEVPAHWEVCQVRHALSVLTDYTANGSFAALAENVNYLSEGFSRLVRLTDLRENLDNAGIYVDEPAHNFLSKSELFGGEVLIANVGAYAGYACLMPAIKQKATLGPNMFLMRFDATKTSNRFAATAFSAAYLKEQLNLASTSTAQPKLNKDNVKSCFIVLPPINEQEKILEFIDGDTGRLDTLLAEAQRAIDLLKERRTALISAAVTGKIDVRGLVAMQEAA